MCPARQHPGAHRHRLWARPGVAADELAAARGRHRASADPGVARCVPPQLWLPAGRAGASTPSSGPEHPHVAHPWPAAAYPRPAGMASHRRTYATVPTSPRSDAFMTLHDQLDVTVEHEPGRPPRTRRAWLYGAFGLGVLL